MDYSGGPGQYSSIGGVQTFWDVTGTNWTQYTNGYVTSFGTVQPAAIAPAAVSTSTGVSPLETSYALYGHTIPLSVFGFGRIGGEIISGPWIANGLASFCISFGVPADPSGSRDIREIAFDSEVVWSTNGTAGITSSAGGVFSTESFTFRFYGGTLTQAADSLEIANFGANAVAYRPQILIWFENLPLANTKFRKIPYVAAVIGDATGNDVNLGEAMERIAYSPWVGYTSSQFETSGITDGLVGGGLIIAEQTDFLTLIQQFGRFYPSWDILQTDKLRIVDRGSTVTADITLDKTRLMDKISIVRQEPNSVPSILELTTIDPGADYTLIPSRAQRPRVPVAVTTSVATESAYLPAIMDSSTRTAVVTYTKYHEEQARKQVSFTAMAYGLEIEPGALVELASLGADFSDETFRVKETLHGANYVVECIVEAILKCSAADVDPHIVNVVLLLGFEGADASTGAPGMTDESPAHHGTAAVYGNAQIDTAQFKFGTASLLLDGTGDGIHFPYTADWTLSSSNSDQFTVEAFVIPASTTEISKHFIGQNGAVGFVSWFLATDSSGQLWFRGSTNNGAIPDWPTCKSTGLTWVVNQKYHIAADKDSSGKVRLYRDGVMVGSCTPTNSSLGNANMEDLSIGSTSIAPTVTGSWNGWIDEVRITKGLARYASDSGYAVPTAAFPRT